MLSTNGAPSNQGAPRSSLGELAVTLAMHFLPRCARRAALCALHSGKAHRVYQRDKRPQEVGAVGRPTFVGGEVNCSSVWVAHPLLFVLAAGYGRPR